MSENLIPPNDSPWNTVWTNARLATMVGDGEPFGLIEDAAIAVTGRTIAWVGKTADLPAEGLAECSNRYDCGGRLVTPGLIDCHTHIVYGGHRAREFEQRLHGASYEEISNAGGGIVSTVRDTRSASFDRLYAQSLPRLQTMMDEGVTTIEIKSGYGLTVDDEIKMLKVAKALHASNPVEITTTFLGAHSIPPEFSGNSDGYIDLVCDEMIPAVAEQKLADAVDAFCETIAFSPQQVARVFDAAADYNLPIKLHAEQLSDLKGAVMAARRGALSVDHIEYLHADDVAVVAENGTAAVLLPGAYYCLRETQLPPIDALRKHRVPIAVASDSNPGSSPVGSLLLMLNMACTLFRLTPEEALAGVTRNAALALGMDQETGTVEVGKDADLVAWNVGEPAELSYRIGSNPSEKVLYKGAVR